MNYLACGVMPPEFSYQRGRSLGLKVGFTSGMTHYYSKEELIRSSGGVYQKVNRTKFYKDVMHHLMKDTLQETKQPTKFSNQVFIGLLFSRIVLNG